MKSTPAVIPLFEHVEPNAINEYSIIIRQKEAILATYNLSLYAERLWRVFASQMSPDDENYKTYRCSVAEFAEHFKLKEKNVYTKIRQALQELRQTFVLPIGRGRITGWISHGQITKSIVEVVIDPIIRPFYLDGPGPRARSLLRSTSDFSCNNSYRFYDLFLLKLDEASKKEGRTISELTFFVSINDIRIWLGIEDKYKNYADIKKRIIVPVVSDINGQKLHEKSRIRENNDCDLRVEFSEVKEKRSVIGINFHVLRDHETIEMIAIGKPPIYQSLPDKVKEAYDVFSNLKITKNLLDEAIEKYGNDGFYRIYLNFKSQNPRNRRAYAATCLRNGYMLSEEETAAIMQKPSKQQTPEEKKAEKKFKKQIDELIASWSKEKKAEIIEMVRHAGHGHLLDLIDGEKTWDAIMASPVTKQIILTYIRENFSLL